MGEALTLGGWHCRLDAACPACSMPCLLTDVACISRPTSLLFSNLILLGTLALGAISWIVAFIGQIAAEADKNRQGVLWFGIFLELFLILGIAVVVITDSVALARLQLSVFLAVALVFSVSGINEGIYSSGGSLGAVAAGWFILTIINVLWILFFTSEEDSASYAMLSALGNGRLGGPGGRASRSNGGVPRVSGPTMNNSGGFAGSHQGIGGGYQPTYGQGPSAADVTMGGSKGNGMAGGGGSIRSAHTNPQMTPIAAPGSTVGKSEYGHGSDVGRTGSPGSLSKPSAPGTAEGGAEPTPGYGYRARALYACE